MSVRIVKVFSEVFNGYVKIAVPANHYDANGLAMGWGFWACRFSGLANQISPHVRHCKKPLFLAILFRISGANESRFCLDINPPSVVLPTANPILWQP